MNKNDEDIYSNLIRMQMVNLRKSKGLTQKQLSQQSGLSTKSISNIESEDGASPTLRSIIKYLHTLNSDLYIKENSNNNQITIE